METMLLCKADRSVKLMRYRGGAFDRKIGSKLRRCDRIVRPVCSETVGARASCLAGAACGTDFAGKKRKLLLCGL